MTGMAAGANARALEDTLDALTGLGPEHEALKVHARTLALLVDNVPGEKTFHSEYREALKRLLDAGSTGEQDPFAEIEAEIAAFGAPKPGAAS